ncbi:homeobox protein CDX-1-like [Thalassophryne amazonica]|uniref:homeobox protein CDX-1-like n=1 Tax=Thalassophryne amazonica TaxID=390379 RepID=UPI001471B102|nr:homeobox protein CDX-1-like [Thalassophryne amazonica]XP_034038164.1 homeobox protein CDX-1-like [Thalassophryne amazonica]
MYPTAQRARFPAQTWPLNNQYIPSPCGNITPWGISDPSSDWNSIYASREEYPYGHSFPGSNLSSQVNFTSPELMSTPTPSEEALFTSYTFLSGQDPFTSKKRTHEVIKPTVSGEKTRTKDKYRVVYTEYQRLELETEFQHNRYITMRRKTELSNALSLSERQVKIWFQNRRAKERKITRKKLQHSQQASTTTPALPAMDGTTGTHIPPSPSSNILSDAVSEEY